MAVLIVNDSQFLSELSDQKKIIVKYYTDWCGSCRMFKPKFIRLSEEQQYRNIRFLDINAENNPNARDMVHVNHFPTFAIFLNGVCLSSVATSKEDRVIELIKVLQNN